MHPLHVRASLSAICSASCFMNRLGSACILSLQYEVAGYGGATCDSKQSDMHRRAAFPTLLLHSLSTDRFEIESPCRALQNGAGAVQMSVRMGVALRFRIQEKLLLREAGSTEAVLQAAT